MKYCPTAYCETEQIRTSQDEFSSAMSGLDLLSRVKPSIPSIRETVWEGFSSQVLSSRVRLDCVGSGYIASGQAKYPFHTGNCMGGFLKSRCVLFLSVWFRRVKSSTPPMRETVWEGFSSVFFWRAAISLAKPRFTHYGPVYMTGQYPSHAGNCMGGFLRSRRVQSTLIGTCQVPSRPVKPSTPSHAGNCMGGFLKSGKV